MIKEVEKNYFDMDGVLADFEIHLNSIRGCLVGGAAGDALGYAIEFKKEPNIFSKYGEKGITEYELDRKSGKALISDDTQMTLFTANGLLVGDTRGKLRGIQAEPRCYVGYAYSDWYDTQHFAFEEYTKIRRQERYRCRSWLMDVPEMFERRAPGNTCLSALEGRKDGNGEYPSIDHPANTSKGCGGIMRVAPIALDYQVNEMDELDKEGAELAAITHGHSLGYMPAAVLTHIINRIVYGDKKLTLKDIIIEAKNTVARIFAGDKHLKELTDVVDLAVELSENKEPDLSNIHRIGEGWVAEETLGIAIYCALRYKDDFSAGIIASVNHNGDSDSTGAVTGNILGALLGYDAIEEKWKKNLELIDIIVEMADDLCHGCQMSEFDFDYQDEEWSRKYIHMRWKEQKKEENSISIRKISITDLDTDIIVNAANDGLWAGSGVCGAIFRAAGHDKLQAACDAIGHCDTGSAVITPGFNLKANYIVHAVGPVWNGGTNGEEALLKGAYTRSLELAYEKKCHSIGFPLISAGVFGYPLDDAWRVAIQACRDFFKKNPECGIKVVFAVLDERIVAVGQKELDNKPVADASKDGVSKHKSGKFDMLHISGKEVDAVFFHKPEEPDGYLSNWYISPFDLDGIHYTSTEQYIMYQKCIVFGDKKSADAILATNDTGKQQDIGRNAAGYIGKVWEGMRQAVALRGLYAKFSQNLELRQKLLDTGEAYLVECARTDVTWACGRTLDSDEKRYADKWLGQNILGFALMEVRTGLRAHRNGKR